MKFNIARKLTTALFVLAAFSTAALAQGTPIFNYSGGMQKGVTGTLDDGSGLGSVQTRFWTVGNAATQNSGLSRTNSHLLAMGPDSYAVWADWTDINVISPVPHVAGRTALLYSIENGGKGQFLLMSVGYDEVLGGYDFGQVSNGNVEGAPNQEVPLSIPALRVLSVQDGDAGLAVSVEWDPLTNLKGFYDQAPLDNLLTGVAVRYAMGSEVTSSNRTNECKVAQNGFVNFGTLGADPGTAQIAVPRPQPGTKVFLSLSLLFDGAQPASGTRAFTETAFLGEAVGVTAPAEANPIFRAVSTRSMRRAGPSVSWSMRQEASVSYYVVYGATSETGTFQRICSNVPAIGNLWGPYQVSTSMASARFVRVDAVLFSGRTISSSVVAVSR